jgi:hypothetical protein
MGEIAEPRGARERPDDVEDEQTRGRSPAREDRDPDRHARAQTGRDRDRTEHPAKEASTSSLTRGTREGVCRNIRVLHHFEPPTTPEEIHAAALQYVRKVTGTRAPSKNDNAAFDHAVDEVAKATAKVLAALSTPRGPARTRDGERERARKKWDSRKSRMLANG